MNFLSFSVAALEKHNFSLFERVCLRIFAAHELQSTALDPGYGLFIGYQMLADKHEGLNACLCLLRKNWNNLAEVGIRSAQYMNHRSNTEYCESTSPPRAFITNVLPAPRSFKIACSKQFKFCLNACKGSRTTGRSITNHMTAPS